MHNILGKEHKTNEMGNESRVPEQVIYVCTGDKCKKRGGKELAKFFKSSIKDNKLQKKAEVIKTDCTDRCKFGPVVCFQPQNEWHLQLDVFRAEVLFREKALAQKEQG